MSGLALLPVDIDPLARIRLVCLPYGGGGTAIYYKWRRFLPSEVGLVPLRLPGREDRFGDPPYSDLLLLARDGADAVAKIGDRPFALLGYSLGAYVAFEIARELRRRHQPLPQLLVVSASRAPHLARARPPISRLPDEQLVAEIVRRYDGIPESIRAHKELLELMLPTLRADVHMIEHYDVPVEPPLDVDLLAMGGAEDPGVSAIDVQAWREYTTGRFSAQMFPGGHFFLFRDQEEGTGAANRVGLQTIIDHLMGIAAT